MLSSKQQFILEQAEKLFSVRGCGATTVRDIAKASDVSPAMISYYFNSKEFLIEELFRYRMESARITLAQLVENVDLTSSQKIDALVTHYVLEVFATPDFYKILLSEQMLNMNANVLHFIKESKIFYTRQIEGIVLEGKKKKDFLIDGKVNIVILITSMTGLVMQALVNTEYYRDYNEQAALTNVELYKHLQDELISFLKQSFKNYLKYASV